MASTGLIVGLSILGLIIVIVIIVAIVIGVKKRNDFLYASTIPKVDPKVQAQQIREEQAAKLRNLFGSQQKS